MKFNFSKKKIIVSVVLIFTIVGVMSGFSKIYENNGNKIQKIPFLRTSQDAITDGIILNYTFIFGPTSLESGFTYKHEILDLYNVTWWQEGSGISTWFENTTDRLITNALGPSAFNTGSHTPVWIPTNTNISDVLWISVDGIGDHPWLVTQQFPYFYPGFGSLQLWQLEDLVDPGGFAWYEQSTGFLVYGNFSWSGMWYILKLNDINFNMQNVDQISGLVDGLYVHHNVSFDGGLPLASNFTYQEHMPNMFNVSWRVDIDVGKWWERVTNRIMRDPIPMEPNFGNGNHDPSWIPTNVSIGTILPIAVDGAGDDGYEIIGESVENLAGFGLVEVWLLQSLTYPNATAKYEKSTGLLIDGVFIYPSGYYSFDFIDSNAQFNYVTLPSGGIPGYDLFIILGLIGCVSLIVLHKKRRSHR